MVYGFFCIFVIFCNENKYVNFRVWFGGILDKCFVIINKYSKMGEW